MKKIICAMLSVLIVLSVVGCSGCGNDDKQEFDNSVGGMVAKDFLAALEENPELGVYELVDVVNNSAAVPFETMTERVDESFGFFTGLAVSGLEGYEEAVYIAPEANWVPFMAYVFSLEEGTKANEFSAMLKESADPLWSETFLIEAAPVVAYSGNKVLFVLAPEQFSDDVLIFFGVISPSDVAVSDTDAETTTTTTEEKDIVVDPEELTGETVKIDIGD